MRCFLICPNLQKRNSINDRSIESRLNEFISLVEALQITDIVTTVTVNIDRIKSGIFFGSGKLEELKSLIISQNIELVLIDATLSPMQQRNLELIIKTKVIDRTGLILEIFGSRAQTREGVLQVELAHLQYQKSRLVRSWTHLERQKGGVGFLGGPGETQIESDRRVIAEKIVSIKKMLKKVIQTRSLHRQRRKKNNIPIVSLIGYTNSGKSSIFNLLTSANVCAQNMLFATLDPTMRYIKLLAKKDILLSDTVGFISNLPTGLVSAFKGTLEEIVNADLILHVKDISHPEHNLQAKDVECVIEELDWSGRARPQIIELYNKIDRLSESQLSSLKNKCRKLDSPIMISAKSGDGVQYLKNRILKTFNPVSKTETIFLPFNQSKIRAWLFNENIVSEEKRLDNGFSLKVIWSNEQKYRYNQLVVLK
tara:strand:- start:301 stop:1575 length:1275 start_codon:yes stop_codon:yes gene_type:complete